MGLGNSFLTDLCASISSDCSDLTLHWSDLSPSSKRQPRKEGEAAEAAEARAKRRKKALFIFVGFASFFALL